MTKEELAALLNGRQMGDEITSEEAKLAREAGLVVTFGHSDDCVEFRGAVHDEATPGDANDIWLDRGGLKRLPEEDSEVLERHGLLGAFMAKARKITAIFGSEDELPWLIGSTAFPVAHFDIFEGEEKFCRGIVFSINDLPA